MKLYKRLFYLKLTLTFIIFLLFALLLSVRYVCAVNADTNSAENADTVYIDKVDDLKYLTDLRYSGKMFLLMCDIDLSGKEWNPVDTYRMSGTFDGCEHTIKNFTVESEDKYTGLFSRNKLNIKNLFISSAFIKGGENSGVLAGLNLGDISNVHISGEITAQSNAGGLIAENYGIIDNCSFEGTVYGRKAGGLIALNESALIQNSYSKGTVSGHVIGGLISSAMQSNAGITEIKTSFSFSELVQIELSESAKRAGGLIGVRDNGITISNCFAGNDYPAISLGSFDGVKELNTTKRNEKGTYSEFDFANYWNWDEELNEITQRTITVSSNLIKLDSQHVLIVGDKNFFYKTKR